MKLSCAPKWFKPIISARTYRNKTTSFLFYFRPLFWTLNASIAYSNYSSRNSRKIFLKETLYMLILLVVTAKNILIVYSKIFNRTINSFANIPDYSCQLYKLGPLNEHKFEHDHVASRNRSSRWHCRGLRFCSARMWTVIDALNDKVGGFQLTLNLSSNLVNVDFPSVVLAAKQENIIQNMLYTDTFYERF